MGKSQGQCTGKWGPRVRATSHLPVPAPPPPAFDQIGGYEQLAAAYARAIPSRTIANTTCHLPREDAMHMFRDPYSGDLPWPGMTLGLTIMATWYWCTDQVSVHVAVRPTFLPSGWAPDSLRGPRNTRLGSVGWGTGHGPQSPRPGHRALGVLAVPGALGPPFRIRRGPLAAARPGLQVL